MRSGQQNQLQQKQKQMTRIDLPKPQKQQSLEISGNGQQNPQQKQSQQGFGNAQKETKFVIFDYEQFLQIMQQGLLKQEVNQENSQQKLLNQFQCMSHKNKFIEAICVNEECKAPNRRMCFDCIKKGEHNLDKNGQQQLNQPLNENELNNVMTNYKLFVNKQINYFQYIFYFEQLKLTNKRDKKIASIKIDELDKIDNQIKYSQEILDQINIKGYINQQHDTNLGIFNYFLQYYKEITKINQTIDKYYQVKKVIKDSNSIEQLKIDPNPNQMEAFNSLKKKKHLIIHKIIETQFYKNEEIDYKDQRFIEQQIEEIGQLGDIFHQQEQYELALQCYEVKIISNPNDPSNSDYYSNKGICLQNLQKYEQSIQMYDKAIHLNPQNPKYYSNKGISLKNLQRYEDSIEMYDKAILLNPQDPVYYYNKGNSLKNLLRYDEAIHMYDKAIHLNSKDPDYYYNKGISLYDLQRYQDSIEMYDKAINLNPQNPKYYSNKGNSLDDLQRYEEAIQMYDNAIQLNPQDPDYYFNKGISLKNIQRYEEAIQMHDMAIHLNPQDPDYYYNKGISLKYLQRHDEAIHMYDKAINLNQQDPRYYSNKGISLQNLQRYDESIQMYDKAIHLNPQHPDYYYNRGISLQNLQRYEEAKIMFYKVQLLENS